MRRGAALLLATAAAVSGCGSEAQSWSTADLFVVTAVGDAATLVAVDLEDNRAYVAAELSDEGIETLDTSTVYYDRGRVLLGWTANNEPRRYAWLDAAQQEVVKLGTSDIDLGIAKLHGGDLVGVGAFVESAPTVIRRSLADDTLTSSGALRLSPAELAAGDNRVFVVGSTDAAGTVVQRVAPDLSLGEAVIVAADALPGEVAAAGDRAVIALHKRVPAGVSPLARAVLADDNRIVVLDPDGEIHVVTGAAAPFFVVALDANTVATDGSDPRGRRIVQFLDVGSDSVAASIVLPDTAPVQGLIRLDEDRVAVLQAGTVSGRL